MNLKWFYVTLIKLKTYFSSGAEKKAILLVIIICGNKYVVPCVLDDRKLLLWVKLCTQNRTCHLLRFPTPLINNNIIVKNKNANHRYKLKCIFFYLCSKFYKNVILKHQNAIHFLHINKETVWKKMWPFYPALHVIL